MAIALATVLCAVPAAHGAAGDQRREPLLPDSVMRGWGVFARDQCLQCHAVWGLGGQIGPDLGRTEQQDFTAGTLAGSMWNHIPKVYLHGLRNQLEYPRLTQNEMSDLYGFLFLVRYLDEPGDPDAGQRVLREKGCANCHATEGGPQSGAPDLKRWAGYANPIVWAQKMWEHAPKMEQAMQQAGMGWPELDDTDLVNIIAYLRSVGGHEAKVYLEPGSAKNGAHLFAARMCRACHHAGGVGPDLATVSAPKSLAALASRMWNHSPEMTRTMEARGLERSPLSAQEMADIIMYIISLRYDDRGGDPSRGRIVFREKRCAECHLEEKSEGAAAPALIDLGSTADPVRLAPAMWNHGLTMMAQMIETGIVWPVFQPGEMVDLIAYLESIAPTDETGSAASFPPSPARDLPLQAVGPAIEVGATCVSSVCHAGVIAERAVHAPAAQGACDTCHTLLEPQGHRFALVSSNSALCYQCHDESAESTHARGPVAVGICTACHNPHSAANLFGPNFTGDEVCFADVFGMTIALETLVSGNLLPWPERVEAPYAGQGSSTVDTPETPRRIGGGCVSGDCHATIVSDAFVHGPTAQHQCEVCHTVIDERNHRFELPVAEPDLCYECHDRPPETAFTHGPVALGLCTVCHDPHRAPNRFMLPKAGSDLCFMCHTEMGTHVQDARVQHGVIEEDGCGACHDPHRGDFEFQLKGEVSELCLDCHTPVGEIIEAAVVSHEPVAKGKKCVNCHNPHGSDVPMILVDVEMNLCLGCHDRPMDTPDGSIIAMKSRIENNPERHGPIRDGNCTGCHQPHGSQHFRILEYEFPRKFYSPFSLETYALCFECHEESIVLDERTITLTGFRNGDKNLHYLHVNQEKGRTCRACHEIHAGTKPKRIKDLVPFGNWGYDVNFEVTENGGRCAPGCHVARAYDRRQEIIQD
ncbi:MAG: cytochrome c3 family protein [Planctomycetota bacterium]